MKLKNSLCYDNDGFYYGRKNQLQTKKQECYSHKFITYWYNKAGRYRLSTVYNAFVPCF